MKNDNNNSVVSDKQIVKLSQQMSKYKLVKS